MMNAVFMFLSVVVSLIALIVRFVLQKRQDDEKFSFWDMGVRIIALVIILVLSIVGYLLIERPIPIWTLLLDFSMLIVFLLPLLQKDYHYENRATLRGILASICMVITFLVLMVQRFWGIEDPEDRTLLMLFIKSVIYELCAIWNCLTYDVGKNGRLMTFGKRLWTLCKENRLCFMDYLALAWLEIYASACGPAGGLCLYGLHDLINQRCKKGAAFLVVGNICFYIGIRVPYGGVLCLLYLLVAIIDCIYFAVQYRKQ